MLSDAYKDSEIHEWCHDSANDWACWPISLSQLIAPILLLFFHARYVLAFFWVEFTIIVHLVLPVETKRIERALYAHGEKHDLR